MTAVATPVGKADVRLEVPEGTPTAMLLLGHGAGGGVDSADLAEVAAAALAVGYAVARITQPYRVAGRRSPAPAVQLDAAWVAVVGQLRDDGPFAGLPVVCGGRSSGARVACRTAEATGATGVLCLAFPLVPPQRRGAAKPAPSRQAELDAVAVPVLVVQGENDRFGMPAAGPRRTVVRLRGDHRLASDVPGLRGAVGDWLAALTGSH